MLLRPLNSQPARRMARRILRRSRLLTRPDDRLADRCKRLRFFCILAMVVRKRGQDLLPSRLNRDGLEEQPLERMTRCILDSCRDCSTTALAYRLEPPLPLLSFAANLSHVRAFACASAGTVAKTVSTAQAHKTGLKPLDRARKTWVRRKTQFPTGEQERQDLNTGVALNRLLKP